MNSTHLRPTFAVAIVIAAVVLGGLLLDGVILAPSAGTQLVGGSVTITASPGWVLVSPSAGGSGGGSGGADTVSHGITLQKGDATLAAQVVSQDYSGDSAEIMASVRAQLETQVAQISYGDQHRTTIGGNDATYVLFEAIVSDYGPGGASDGGSQTGTLDGELVCLIVAGNAVVVEVAAPQGHLRFVIDDVSAMVGSVRAAA